MADVEERLLPSRTEWFWTELELLREASLGTEDPFALLAAARANCDAPRAFRDRLQDNRVPGARCTV